LLLHIVAKGRIGRSPEGELVERYMKRIAWPTRLTELADSGGKMPVRGPGTVLVMLDEKGQQLGSTAFAKRLDHWRQEGRREARFLIGGADGFVESERREADLLIAFGRATWPHLMARAMLAEQLYRATTILAGHPYHREG